MKPVTRNMDEPATWLFIRADFPDHSMVDRVSLVHRDQYQEG
jgi:hypothetical protein